ncbi:MAG: DinB family protein [Acidobacteriota bacterium]
MLNDVLSQHYEQVLVKLKKEVEQYTDDAAMWKTSGEIPNSGGNLTLHLIGNLKHFFGAVLGGTDFVRDRDTEFTTKNVSREELLRQIDATIPVVVETIKKLNAEDLEKIYPIEVFGHPMTTEYFYTYLVGHTYYHLGQINYHRRLLGS